MQWYLIIFVVIILAFGLVVFFGAPYVPTKRRPLGHAFDNLYPISKTDVLVDIGSGDGVVLRMAAARGARAVGYELNPVLYVVSRILSRNSLIKVHLMDYRFVTFPSETTIIYTFGDSRDIQRMYRKAEETAKAHKKNIFFMSFGFRVLNKKFIKHDDFFYLYHIRYLQPA